MNKEYFMALGLSEEQAEAAVAKHQEEIQSVVTNKEKILSEKKSVSEENKSLAQKIADFEAKQREFELKASQDEVTKLFASGDVEGAKKLLSESLLKEHNEQLNGYKTQVEKEKEEFQNQLKSKEATIMDFMFEKSFTELAMTNELFDKSPGAMRVLKQQALNDFKFEDNKFSFKDDAALINGEKVNPENWLETTVKKDYPFLFQSVSGAGATNTPSNTNNGKISDEEYSNMSTEQRKEADRKGLI